MGLDETAAVGAVAASVGEAQALAVAAGRGDHGQVLGLDRRAGEGGRDRRRSQRRDAAAQVSGQDLLELDERADGGLLDPGHRCARRGPQPDGDRDRLLIVEQQRRHRGARREAGSRRRGR